MTGTMTLSERLRYTVKVHERHLGGRDPIAHDCAEAAAELDRLTAENAELRKEVERLLDPRISDMRLEGGNLDMTLVGPAIERFATMLGGWFVHGGAVNYAEMRLHDKVETDSVYIVTVQKSGMKTPHDLRREAEAQVTALTAENVSLRNELRDAAEKYDEHLDEIAALTTRVKELEDGTAFRNLNLQVAEMRARVKELEEGLRFIRGMADLAKDKVTLHHGALLAVSGHARALLGEG